MFHIIGLPRSRTAWLANFMTYGKTFCHHEGMNGCHSLDEYIEKIGNDGDSGTGLMFISHHFDIPRVIIEAPLERSVRFARDVFGVDARPLLEMAKARMDALDGLRVAFDEIDDRLPKIWAHLTDDPYDERRGEMLRKLNVQAHNPHDIDLQAMRNFLWAG